MKSRGQLHAAGQLQLRESSVRQRNRGFSAALNVPMETVSSSFGRMHTTITIRSLLEPLDHMSRAQIVPASAGLALRTRPSQRITLRSNRTSPMADRLPISLLILPWTKSTPHLIVHLALVRCSTAASTRRMLLSVNTPSGSRSVFTCFWRYHYSLTKTNKRRIVGSWSSA